MILDKIPLRRIYTHVPVADAPEWARDLALMLMRVAAAYPGAKAE